jgi:hypothetical protein
VSYAVSREKSDVDPTLGPLLGLQDGMLSAWSLDVDHSRRTDSATPVRNL